MHKRLLGNLGGIPRIMIENEDYESFFLTILLIYMSAVLHAQERVDTLEAAVKTDV